ncbi:MAG: nitrite reductase large subunit NirB [Egibacteraceae bacterium]
MRRLVVIGNGMAGARAVEEILARDKARQFQITMFGDEPYGNYNRILLSEVLAGAADAREIFLNPLAWYEEHGITLHAGVRVTEIDRWAKKISADDGGVTGYDNLLIATGSRPFIPPIQGLTDGEGGLRPGVFAFRTIDDCNAMTAYAANCRRVAVIGGGLLGLEAARGMLGLGLQVHVVHSSPVLMNQQLDAEAGAILKASVERLGIHIHLQRRTVAVHGDQRVSALEFTDGTTLEADMVILAAGIRPDVDLAFRAGLTVERGIVVDDQMRSVDDPDIYVVGECVQHRDRVYGLVAPLWEQAGVLAEHITGRDRHAAYHGSKLVTKLKVAGVDLAVMGIKEPERPDDEFVKVAEPKQGRYKTIVARDGKLVGATLLGDLGKVAFLTQAFDRGTPLPAERLSLLFDLGAPPTGTSVAQMADDMQVCNCNGVSKGAIRACVAAGRRSVKGVMDATRAGMGCGACKAMVADVVEWAVGDDLEEDSSTHWYVPGVPLAKPELVAAVKARGLRSVSSVFAALAGGVEDPLSKPGLASLLKIVWGAEYEDERDARFINDRVHANVQRDGTFSVVPRISGGITTAEQLRRIADVADKYQVPMIKITGGQRIDLLGIAKDDLPRVWEDLGMPSGFAYAKTFRTVKTCVGTDFCRFGLGDSTTLGMAIEDRYKGLESPAKMKLAVAGCPRNCSEAMVKDVGVVAIEGGRWEIYVGGACGATVRKGDVLATVDTHDDVLRLTGRFMQYYREHARWLERTYDFVPRIGLERLRAVIVDDAERLAAGLDARMQASVDAYRDPWQTEAAAPKTAGQFSSVLA